MKFKKNIKYRIAIQRFEHGHPTTFRNLMLLDEDNIDNIKQRIEKVFK